MPQERFLADPDIVCRREPEHAILFNPDTDAFQGINVVGFLIWQALAQPRTQEKIVAHVVAACEDAPIKQVSKDVAEFLQALRPGGFVGQVLDGDDQFYGTPPENRERAPESALSLKTDDEDRTSFYHGGSMLGTFRPGDRLTTESVPLAAIRPGDVVIYRGREELDQPERIVHRVRAVTPAGLVTQGDNVSYPDTNPVTEETLLGRVTHLEREGRVHRVRGSHWGLLRLRALRAWVVGRTLGWRLLRRVGGGAYRRLREGGLVRRLWQPPLTRIRVEGRDGPLIKYVHCGQTVACWRPEQGRFTCRRPYNLVISRPNGKKSVS